MAEVKCDGVWLSTLGFVGGLKWSSRWGDGSCGPATASWSMDLPMRTSHKALLPGKVVEIMHGSRTWMGVLTEPVRGVPWSFSAIGLASLGNVPALDSDGNPTAILSTAVTEAIARGLQWTSASGFPETAYGEDTNRPSVAGLATEWAKSTGQRWGVDHHGRAFVASDPTAPKWVLDASGVEIGVADDELYTSIRAYYVSAAGSESTPDTISSVHAVDAAAQARWPGLREYVLSLTDLGVISGTQALDYAQQRLAQMTRPAWTNRLTVSSTELTTTGGIRADLASVRAGDAALMFGVNDGLGALGGELAHVVTLGEVEYEDGSDEITLASTSLATRTLEDQIADMVAARREQEQAAAK